jgi:hypothetical protein
LDASAGELFLAAIGWFFDPVISIRDGAMRNPGELPHPSEQKPLAEDPVSRT